MEYIYLRKSVSSIVVFYILKKLDTRGALYHVIRTVRKSYLHIEFVTER